VWTSAKQWHKGPLSAQQTTAATTATATAAAAAAEQDVYDIVSMQFALHYMGQTEAKLRKFFRFISDRMRLGAQFIATTADARVLIDLLMRHSEKSPNGQVRLQRVHIHHAVLSLHTVAQLFIVHSSVHLLLCSCRCAQAS
jgi:mRNA capping enzyme